MNIPPAFDESFLMWFRARTEAAWASGVPRRWLPGLSECEIADIEHEWDIRFPPDYRLFLRLLHAIGEATADAGQSRRPLMPVKKSGIVFNWQLDKQDLQAAFEWPFEGLRFDVEHNVLWLPSWGTRPGTPAERESILRSHLATAPKLIPIRGHRYLVGEPCRAGNPVLSVHQSDIIVYGADLRSYLLVEFAPDLGLDQHAIRQRHAYATVNGEWIPFWGEIIEGQYET